MTRNSRKKLSLSVKRFPSRKKQMGGALVAGGGTTIYHNHDIRRGNLMARGKLSSEIRDDANLVKILNDPSGFYGIWESYMKGLEDIREIYINTLKMKSHKELKKLIKKWEKEQKPKFIINQTVLKKDNDNISITHDEKQRESKTFIEQKRTQHEKSLNNIRIMIIKEMYILIDKEIIKLKEFIS